MVNKFYEINYLNYVVEDVLPAYFVQEYPDIVNFLKLYYLFMQEEDNPNQLINDLKNIQNIDLMSLKALNQLFYEIGNGIVIDDLAADPKFMAKILPKFYKVKGSLYSIEGFFRAYYGVQPEVVYPKRTLFTVGVSRVGPEEGHYIQDGKLWQTLSILIKTPIPIKEWKDKYTRFCHPAGFWLSGEVIIESMAYEDITYMPISINDDNANIKQLELYTDNNDSLYAWGETSLIIGDQTYSELIEDDNTKSADMTIDSIKDLTINELDTQYKTLYELSDDEGQTVDSDVLDSTNEYTTTDRE